MKSGRRQFASTTLFALLGFISPFGGIQAQSTSAPVVLNRESAAAILPPSVFFRGRTASIQARNSGGLRLADGKLVLVALVDTGGYASGIQEKYQAYLLTEVPLKIGGQTLPPGAYGFGFVDGNRMTVMDVGGNEVLHAVTTRDESLARPTPLQVLLDKSGAKIYLGRNFVTISPVQR